MSGPVSLPPRHRSIRLVEMIVVESHEGEGTPEDPGRCVFYWYEGTELRFIDDPTGRITLKPEGGDA